MRILAAALIAAGLLASPAAAQQPERESPGELLDDAAQKMLQALKLMLMAIPQYAAPEINENGDIIIRRIHPEDEKPEPEKEEAPEKAPGKAIQTQT